MKLYRIDTEHFLITEHEVQKVELIDSPGVVIHAWMNGDNPITIGGSRTADCEIGVTAFWTREEAEHAYKTDTRFNIIKQVNLIDELEVKIKEAKSRLCFLREALSMQLGTE